MIHCHLVKSYAESKVCECDSNDTLMLLLYNVGADVWTVGIKEGCAYQPKGLTE
jgi:hypothetical protein